MRFGLLGPLAVVGDSGAEVLVAAARQRVLLAALLVHTCQPVPADTLAEAVWDGLPPPGYATTLRSYVMRLRQTLGAETARRLVTRSPGYLFQASESELDMARFEALCRHTATALQSGAWAEASRTAGDALALWRGTPLVDVPSSVLRTAWVPRLEELHLQALERRAEAELRLGHRDALVPELYDLTVRYPLRESLHAALIRALAGSGQRARALEAYLHARRVLVDELGIEPGPELRALHRRVLDGEPEPTPPSRAVVSQRTAAPIRQLPLAVRRFVGRSAEIGALSTMLAETAPGGTLVCVIGGPAGIGKSALAVRWAHQVAARFPDGQLYVNLRGFDPSGTPVAPADVMRRFLAALGVAADRIPVDPEEQTTLYRSQLANRRMLVLLDNARDAAQVRPLLPGAPGCVVLVTSRDQLRGLVAVDGAVPLTLDLLTHTESRDLLIQRLGQQRLAGQDEVVAELIDLCARLPLALNVAAAHIALNPSHTVLRIADGLRHARRRLDTFTATDDAADLRAVFSWSYRTLGIEAAGLFRLLGIHPGPDISLAAAASLAALDLDDARRALDELTAAHLVSEHVPGRYTFHDLLRAYAAECARTRDSSDDRQLALRRVCDFYVHTAHAAVQVLVPHRPEVGLDPPTPGAVPRQLTDSAAAMAWFDTEHVNLLAAQHTAAEHRWHPTVWQLAWDLTTFHARRGHRQEQLAVCQAALDAAAHLPEPTRIRAHRLTGIAYGDLGRHEESIEHLDAALALAARHADRTEQAHTHRQLAWAWGKQGDNRRALDHCARALALFRALDLPVWEASALNAAGWYSARLGEHDAARTSCEAARALYRQHDNLHGEADTLDSLGYVEHHTGQHRRAVDHYLQALALYRTVAHAYEAANVLDAIGHPYAALGEHGQARDAWNQALRLYRQQGRTQDAERVEYQLATLTPQSRATVDAEGH